MRYHCVTNALLSALPQCVTSLFIVFAIETLNRVALEKVSLERLYCMTGFNDSITKTMKRDVTHWGNALNNALITHW